MKTIKLLSKILFVSILSMTSCQDEIDNDNTTNPDTNSANSVTASNLERAARYNGSFDDFLDGTSCSSIILPITATVNGTQLTILSESDYSLVIDILGQITNDDDTIELQFPLTVQLSNYTQVVVTNQAQYDDLVNACEQLENEGESAINCLDFNFPISILTFNATQEQTGSVVLESSEAMFTFMNNLSDDEFFSVNYPITATLSNSSTVNITSDMDLQFEITDCLDNQEAIDDAEEQADNLTDILVDGLFRVESFIVASVETANDFAEFSFDFANNLTVVAENTVNTAINDVEGTYQVASEFEIFLSLDFTSNATIQILNDTWEVTNFTSSSISLQSTTNSTTTVVLSQI